MSGLDNLSTRVDYRGGKQQDRMINGKLTSLKRALLYSYQAATAILEDGREFRCLINPDKLKIDRDDKIISIPFSEPPVGETEAIDTDFHNGTVFKWVHGNKEEWNNMMKRAMEKDFSWQASAKKYQEMYDWLKG